MGGARQGGAGPQWRHPHAEAQFRHAPAGIRCGYPYHPAPARHGHVSTTHALLSPGAKQTDRHRVAAGVASPRPPLAAIMAHGVGLGRHLARPRPALSRRTRFVHRPGQGVAGYHRLPHPGAGRSCRVLRSLRRAALHVPFMPQPALPAVPDARQGSLARGAAAGAVAGAVLPSGVHLAARP